MVAQLCEDTKIHRTAHFKRMNFMVCEFYLQKAVIKKYKSTLAGLIRNSKLSLDCRDDDMSQNTDDSKRGASDEKDADVQT